MWSWTSKTVRILFKTPKEVLAEVARRRRELCSQLLKYKKYLDLDEILNILTHLFDPENLVNEELNDEDKEKVRKLVRHMNQHPAFQQKESTAVQYYHLLKLRVSEHYREKEPWVASWKNKKGEWLPLKVIASYKNVDMELYKGLEPAIDLWTIAAVISPSQSATERAGKYCAMVERQGSSTRFSKAYTNLDIQKLVEEDKQDRVMEEVFLKMNRVPLHLLPVDQLRQLYERRFRPLLTRDPTSLAKALKTLRSEEQTKVKFFLGLKLSDAEMKAIKLPQKKVSKRKAGVHVEFPEPKRKKAKLIAETPNKIADYLDNSDDVEMVELVDCPPAVIRGKPVEQQPKDKSLAPPPKRAASAQVNRRQSKLYFKRKPKAASAAQPRKPKPKKKPRKSVGAKETKKSSPKAVALKKPPEKTQKSEL